VRSSISTGRHDRLQNYTMTEIRNGEIGFQFKEWARRGIASDSSGVIELRWQTDRLSVLRAKEPLDR
jgi:hypothetical protein